MAAPQKVVHGLWSRTWVGLVMVSLTGVGLGEGWEVARASITHGQGAFLLTVALAMVVVGIPLRLAEILLGRRSRRAPIEGMAVLTREIDAPRYWRVLGWGMLLVNLLMLSILALICGWAAAYLGHLTLSAHQAEAYTLREAGGSLILGTIGVLVAAAVLAWRGVLRLGPALLGLGAAVVALLAVASAMSPQGWVMLLSGSMSDAFTASSLALAIRYAALAAGGGLGLWFVAGVYMPKEESVAAFTVKALLVQFALFVLMAVITLPSAYWLAKSTSLVELLTISLPVAMLHAGYGLSCLVFIVVALSGLVGLVALEEPLHLYLIERGLKPVFAFAGVYVAAGLVAILLILPFDVVALSRVLLILLSFIMAVFVGWKMKISHARKDLALPDETIYNLWRIAIRIIVPLGLILVAWKALG